LGKPAQKAGFFVPVHNHTGLIQKIPPLPAYKDVGLFSFGAFPPSDGPGFLLQVLKPAL
jgi:hypothetical protein